MRGNHLIKTIDRYAGILFLGVSGRGRVPRHPPARSSVRRILALKFAAIGDSVLLVPALRSLRSAYPEAEIVFLGTSLTVPFLRSFGDLIDTYMTVNPGSPGEILAAISVLRRSPVDVAIDFEQWMRLSALVVRWSGAPHRFGFETRHEHRTAGFSRTVPHSPAAHEVNNFLALAGLAGGAGDHGKPEVRPDEASLIFAQQALQAMGWNRRDPLVIVHPGCGVHGGPREWRPDRYAALLTRLGAGRSITAVVSGTAQEEPLMKQVQAGAGIPVALFRIEGLDRFIAALSFASLFVSSNNGAMHLAAGLGLPQIALHGPTDAKRWGPLNDRATVLSSGCPGCPCLDLGFEYHRTDGFCMDQIGVDEVVRAAERALERYSGREPDVDAAPV